MLIGRINRGRESLSSLASAILQHQQHRFFLAGALQLMRRCCHYVPLGSEVETARGRTRAVARARYAAVPSHYSTFLCPRVMECAVSIGARNRVCGAALAALPGIGLGIGRPLRAEPGKQRQTRAQMRLMTDRCKKRDRRAHQQEIRDSKNSSSDSHQRILTD
jgi:hypothetical protein